MNYSQSKPILVNRPKILLADTNRWALSARLGMALTEAGFQVSAVCATPKHPLHKTRAVHQTFPYKGLDPLGSLGRAIAAVEPALIVPCCDRSVGHLHQMCTIAQGDEDQVRLALIERSLGSAASYPVVASRFEFLEVARQQGVRVPQTQRVEHPERLASQVSEFLPCVLKANGTWGGGGVKIIHRSDQTEPAMEQLNQLFRFKRAFKRLLVNRDSFWLHSWWNESGHEVILQAYIEGKAANTAVVCWKGQVLAGISVEVSECDGATGPARVVRVVDNPEMMSAAVRIASRLGLSGFFGLDFVIEEASQAAYLIEMNPRATPLSHFRLGPGRDLAGALAAQIGLQNNERSAVTEKEMITYFPQQRGIAPELLAASFLDTPENEPELVEDLRNPWPDRTLLFRLSSWMSRRGAAAASADTNRLPLTMKSTDVRSGSRGGVPLA